MPNNVINEVVFRGVGEVEQTNLLKKIVNAEGLIDFEVLLPLPLNIWWGSVGAQHEKAFHETSLNWCRENWGTKWNAYGPRKVERADDTLTLLFETAWSPPYGWLVAVFNHFKVSFHHNWLDEGAIRGRCGRFDWPPDGDLSVHEAWREADADDAEHRRLHKLMWGVEVFAEEDSDAPSAGS